MQHATTTTDGATCTVAGAQEILALRDRKSVQRYDGELRPRRGERGERLYDVISVRALRERLDAAREARLAARVLRDANKDAAKRGWPKRKIVITVRSPGGQEFAATCVSMDDVPGVCVALCDALKRGGD